MLQYDGKCYYFYNIQKDFEDARSMCKDLGFGYAELMSGHIYEPKKEINFKILSWESGKRKFGFGRNDYTSWLGIKKQETWKPEIGKYSQKFVYASDNVTLNTNLLNSLWGCGQPNSKIHSLDCVVYDQSDFWLTTKCDEKHRFVCEFYLKGM